MAIPRLSNDLNFKLFRTWMAMARLLIWFIPIVAGTEVQVEDIFTSDSDSNANNTIHPAIIDPTVDEQMINVFADFMPKNPIVPGNSTISQLISARIAEIILPLCLMSVFVTFGGFVVCICCPTCILKRLRDHRLKKGYKRKPLVVTVLPNPIQESALSTVPGVSRRKVSYPPKSAAQETVEVHAESPPTIKISDEIAKTVEVETTELCRADVNTILFIEDTELDLTEAKAPINGPSELK